MGKKVFFFFPKRQKEIEEKIAFFFLLVLDALTTVMGLCLGVLGIKKGSTVAMENYHMPNDIIRI
jgi:hypothetical protein